MERLEPRKSVDRDVDDLRTIDELIADAQSSEHDWVIVFAGELLAMKRLINEKG